MQKDELKGGKSDKISLEDISKKHNVNLDSIKDQIKIGKKIELEHVNDDKLAEEIAKDHLYEIPDYYTRLEKMEKDAKKDLKLESKRFMALAGIKEGDNKFLNNESFSESNNATLYPEGWKEIDGIFMGPNRITQEKLDAVTKAIEKENAEGKIIKESMGDITPDEWANMFQSKNKSIEENKKDNDDFIVFELDKKDFEPGQDDNKLYKLG